MAKALTILAAPGTAFTARIVATSAAGDTVAILETRRLGAKTLAGAKVEVNRRRHAAKHLPRHVLEIVDDNGTVLARRQQNGKNVQTPWS